MAASPAPTRPPDLAEWANSRLYKIAHPAIFWCRHARKQARIPVNTAEDSLAPLCVPKTRFCNRGDEGRRAAHAT
jgi:hypothetical protein